MPSSRVPFDPILAWEHAVRWCLFILLGIRTRSTDSIADEVKLRMILDMPDSEPDSD